MPALPRPTRRMAAGALVVLVLLIPGWLLLRDSSVVAVDHVHVSGLSGPQAEQIRQVIVDASRQMTTLDVDPAKIASAVREFPVVEGISVKAHPLHTLDVTVQEYVPVAALTRGGARVAVAGDGTILQGTLTKDLPQVPVGAPPGGRRLVEKKALQMVAMLAAAPASLRSRVSSATIDEHGLVAHLRAGPDLYFGPGTRLAAKWIAAARVLGDYTSRGTTYLDLRVPERPAAGGDSQPVLQPSQ
jgi:cell division protein FtsQ